MTVGMRYELGFLADASSYTPNRYDSGVAEVGDAVWEVNDSDLDDYSSRANFFGHPGGLTATIDAQIGRDCGNVGLELAAGTNAQALRALVHSGVLGKALATNYEDVRTPELLRDSRIDHVAGDLTTAEPWEQIIDWTHQHAPEGLALVMHRPVGGLQNLQPQTYKAAIHLLLDMVKPGGLLFAQVPRGLRREQRKLADVCQSIRARQDVNEIIGSEPLYADGDNYAVILK